MDLVPEHGVGILSRTCLHRMAFDMLRPGWGGGGVSMKDYGNQDHVCVTSACC